MDRNYYVQLPGFSPLYLNQQFMIDWISKNLNKLLDKDTDVDIMYGGWFCCIIYDIAEQCYCLKSLSVEEVYIKLN